MSAFLRNGLFLAVFSALFLIWSGGALRAASWIQVESQQTLRDTLDRARFFARQFPRTKAFTTTTDWNAIVIGPMGRAEANRLLRKWKAEGRIPPDSFVSDGSWLRRQLFPLSADGVVAPEPPAEPVEGVVVGPVTPRPGELPAAAANPDIPPEGGTTTPPAADGTAPEPEPAPEPAVEPAPEAPPVDAPADKPARAGAAATPPGPPVEAEVIGPVTPDPADAESARAEPEPAGPIPDPDLAATKRMERGWSPAQKKLYQEWLSWTGDYKAAIDGAYGPGTRAAIRAFQAREGFQATGYLTEAQIALLKKRYEEKVAAIGPERVTDEDAGIELLMPMGMVQFERIDPPFVRYGPRNDSGVRVMLISQTGDRNALRALYDVMESLDFVPPKGYRKRTRDWFVLSGKDDRVVSYTYARLTRDGIKGFTVIWPPRLDGLMRRFAIDMYNSFTPIKGLVLDDAVAPATVTTDLAEGLDMPEPARQATGFVINDQGAVLTHTANIRACSRITIGDGIEMKMTARAPELSLAVLVPVKAWSPDAVARFATQEPRIGTEVTVAGFSFPEVMELATLNMGTVTDTRGLRGDARRLRVSAFLEPGDMGGPVLDATGAVLGVESQRAAADGSLPDYVNFAVKAAEITAFLDREGIPWQAADGTQPLAPEDLAARAAAFTVKVSCWR